MSNTVALEWKQVQPAWNASSDKRYTNWLVANKDNAPGILHEDGVNELTRYEFFEKEYNVCMEPPPINTNGKYKLTFNTPQDLTIFILRWR
jgi:hypothetical protein